MGQNFYNTSTSDKPSVLVTFVSRPLYVFLFYLCVGLILYSLILKAQFKIVDDVYTLILNQNIRSFRHLWTILTTSFFGEGSYYRPLVYISFMIEYHFFKLNSFFYNLDNVLIHVLNAYCVFLIASRIVKDKTLAFWTAFIFLIHPMQAEGVSNIPGRSILLCALFFFLSFYFFLRYLEKPRGVIGFFFLCIGCYGLSLLAKETAVVLPVLIMSYLFCFKNEIQINYGSKRFIVASFWVVTIFYFITRKVLGIISAFHWNGISESILGLITFLKSVLIYFYLLVLPTDIYYDRSLVLFKSFTDPALWGVIAVWVVGGVVFFRMRNRISMLVLFFISWFWIGLLTVAQIVPLKISPDHISTADHFVYISSVGFFICLILLVQKIGQYLKDQRIISDAYGRFFVAGWILFWVIVTVELNVYSRQQVALFEQSLERNPHNLRLRDSLAVAYNIMGYYAEALKNYNLVLKDNPWDPKAIIGIGKVLSDQKKYWESIQEYEKIGDAGIFEDLRRNNLNYSYEELIKWYEEKLKKDPTNAKLHYSLGIVFTKRQRTKEAVDMFEQAIKLDPVFKKAYFNLASLCDALGNWQKAVENYEQSIKLDDGENDTDAPAYERLAFFYTHKQGDPQKAAEYSEKARTSVKKQDKLTQMELK